MPQMSIRNFALKTTALFVLATMTASVSAMPLQQASADLPTGVATNVVLIVTTASTISFGEDVSVYAQVTSSDGSILTGTVSFYDGAENICTIPISQMASYSASAGNGFAVGTHMVTAVYSGDATHLSATSDAVPVIVIPDVAATTLTGSANRATAFTATVGTALAAPTEPVSYPDGSTVLGAANLNNLGGATTSLAADSHTITATYAGDAKNAASSSTALTEIVKGPSPTGQNSFTLAVTGSSTVDIGRATNLLVTVTPQTGSIQPVQLSCTDLPSESTCTFGTQTLPVNGGTTSLQITTMFPHSCESTTSSAQNEGLPFAGPVLAGLMLLFIPRRKRKAVKGLLLALVAVCGLAALTPLTGCGNCTDLGTRPGDYTIKVVGTSTEVATNTVITKIVLHVTVP